MVNIRIGNVRDLELFANCIKDALVTRVGERFSTIRLRGAPLRYNDFLDEGKREQARHDGVMEVAQRDSALQLAGTIIHEMAHVLVGTQQAHNNNWNDAACALGLVIAVPKGQVYEPDHFNKDVLKVIEAAIAQFARDYPTLVYDPLMEIPWPWSVGTYACVDYNIANGNGCAAHRAHIMKFQIDGIREMLGREGNILLADEMGTGKTVEVMGYINATMPKRILIGCPNNAKLIWKRHFEDFCVHPYEVEVAGSSLYLFSDVVIMNYEALTKWGSELKKQEWDLVVYDEGHYLKTPNAKRSKTAYSIMGSKAIIVTGTPIVNYPYELFPLIHYLDRTNWPEYGRFEAQFGSRSSERLGRNLNRLNAMLRATIMTRRLKKDVLAELPRKRRQIVEFEVPDDVRKLIEEEKKLFQQFQGNDTNAVDLLNAMRNESDVAEGEVDWAAIIEELRYTKRYAFEEMSRIAHLIGLAKLPLVIEHIENALDAREKVMVFGHHRDVLQAIADKFKPNSVLHLGNSKEPAPILAEQFNNNENLTLWVGGISMAQSYSLASSTCIFAEEMWVPGDMTQAEDRGHGIGRGDASAKSMLIQHLVFEDSLDTYKAKLTIRKQKSIDRAVGSVR